ncbi:DNA gyrase subunit A [Acidocella sp. MX-AZ02]|uniref:DNA gyrase subunit A n=1 Tax=Acidocella sp. MX-AZ02 TaxID=1214225 RepID=UPI00028E8EE3|nr:DNA gyrase subunit A [Acidocella sp. MX-AZ02]EKN00570.1 DNA gyrase subunit A [Acidocella sp. MX-AZ02]
MSEITDEPGAGPLTPRGQEPVSIEQEMRKSYLDYAMSVIVSRALPDARDGLKPVHRRILYAMNEANNTPDKPYRKSARMTGDVLGKYHPHGDQAVYLAGVRLAQDFSMRLPLIDGQGNFGSIDGDNPAASRYTEMRLAPPAMLLLADIDKDTVDFQANYDESEQEPKVLPAAFPNLLINGAGGIAVGMATNIPPHNPTEIMDAVLAMISNPEITLEELMKIVPGPDFPTAGIILGRSGIRNAYETGRGSIIMRSRATIEQIRKDRDAIIVTEIPYQVNKSTLLERIAELVRAKEIEGIADLRDESDREGMRIVIELKRDATGEVVLNQLYRLTSLQQSFGINMLALDRGKPRQMGLRELLRLFIEFREEVILRRARFDLNKARDRAHLLIGLGIAVANIDEVIRLIRAAPDSNAARAALMARDWPADDVLPLLALVDDSGNAVADNNTIKLTEAQARGILELRLARLTGLEREKIQAELAEVSEKIKEFLDIIGSRIRRLEVMQQEIVAAKDKIGSARKSSIEDLDADLDDESLIEPGQMVITLTRDGFIKRTPLEVFRQQNRGGRGRSAAATRGDDIVTRSFNAHTHQFVLFFSSGGKVYREKIWRLPEAAANTKGRALVNLLPELGADQITTVLPLPQDESLWENLHLVFATSSGNVRRNKLSDFRNVRASGLIAMKLDEGDHLIGVATCRDGDDVFLATKLGRCIRFQISDETLRVFSGRDSTGVRGIRLGKDDEVMSLCVLRHVEASVEERAAYLKQRNAAADEEGAAPEESDEAVAEIAISEEKIKELGEAEEILLTVTDSGFGKRSSAYEYRVTGRGGQGVANITLNAKRNGTAVAASFAVRPGDDVMLVTNGGRLIRVPADQVRLTGRTAMGVTLFRLDDDERVTSVFPVLDDEQAEPGETADA